MATGDMADFTRRILAVLPRWFPDPAAAPVVSGIVAGIATAMAQVYALQAYLRLQTRILTATDGWLDLISYDFFGSRLPRRNRESDNAFRARIRANMFDELPTRPGLISVLTTLTGRAPVVFEPARPADAFCLGYSGLGTGRLGSYTMPYQALVTVYRPEGGGGGGIAGLGSNYAGLGCPYMALPSQDTLTGQVTDADIYATIDAAKPAGTIIWTNISN